jgi:hypothetical protein
MALLAAAALSTASAASASVTIDLDSPTGNLGPTHTYTSGPLSVTATGFYCNPLCSPTANLYGKNQGAGEQGLGLVGDPSGDNEIWGPAIYDIWSYVQLDVSGLLGQVTSASFETDSTTQGEMWLLFGSNTDGSLGDFLSYGQDELSHAFTDWGSYDFYSFVSYGTLPLGTDPVEFEGTPTDGNFLLHSLTFTTSVPEPATWAMMLLGFGAIGAAMRRNRKKPALAQLA